MEVYFTSDTHFWHKNILKFENRPYSSVEEMTICMIEKWNSQVNDDDIVYHLGDFCLGSYEQTEDVLKQLKGKVILVKGNHDNPKDCRKLLGLRLLYKYSERPIITKHQEQELWLTHYPYTFGLKSKKWSIHGHLHSSESNWNNQINVGVDSPHFQDKPFGALITIGELFEVMEVRPTSTKMKFTI